MNPAAEFSAQLAFQRKLARLLGRKHALRFRAAMVARRLGFSSKQTISLHPPNLLHPVHLRLDSTDAEVYGQVITAEEYAPVLDPDARTIVDCGANIGLTSAWFLSRLPQAHVIAIEPFAANAELCRRNLAPYGARAQVIQAAIWNRCTRLVLDYAGGNEWGVRVRQASPGETGEIEAIDIPSLCLDRIDILKIDIEGSEAELFSERTENWVNTIGNIAIELHNEVCAQAFATAVAGRGYVVSRSGELTICRERK